MIDLCLLTQKNQTLYGVIGRNIALWQNLWVAVGRFERRSSSARARHLRSAAGSINSGRHVLESRCAERCANDAFSTSFRATLMNALAYRNYIFLINAFSAFLLPFWIFLPCFSFSSPPVIHFRTGFSFLGHGLLAWRLVAFYQETSSRELLTCLLTGVETSRQQFWTISNTMSQEPEDHQYLVECVQDVSWKLTDAQKTGIKTWPILVAE